MQPFDPNIRLVKLANSEQFCLIFGTVHKAPNWKIATAKIVPVVGGEGQSVVVSAAEREVLVAEV